MMDADVLDERQADGHCHDFCAVCLTAGCDEVFESLFLSSFSNGMNRNKLPPTSPAVTISAAITSMDSEFLECI